MMENKTTTVEIADHNGHTVAQMIRDETIQLVSGTGRWVFADGRRVDPQQIAEDDWPSVETVQVMPTIVFG